jgi:DNA-binding XRE family transcriptional regulator/predicted RNase H-like HicB family nuclease
MVLEGKIWKDKGHWLVEVTALDILTQGHSRKVAFAMLKDAIRLLVARKGVHIKIRSHDQETFLVESPDQKDLLALMLKRQRAKHNLTLSDMAKRLHSSSKNAYAQYEQGKSQPSFSKVQEFLSAMNSKAVMALTVFEG